MSTVSDVKLHLKKVRPRSRETKCTVSFTIEFTRTEMELNLQFGLYLVLMEIDHKKDMEHTQLLNPSALNINHQDGQIFNSKYYQDDIIGCIHAEKIIPRGRIRINYSNQFYFEMPKQEGGKEEYQLKVHLYPEISPSVAYSPIFEANIA